MDDLLARALVALAAAGAVAATAFLGRRRKRRQAGVVPLDLTGIEGRVLFFSDALCRRCDIVRRRLEGAGVEFTEISFSDHPDVQRRVGVTGVPLIVVRSGDGSEVARLAGVVRTRRIKAALDS